LFLPTEVCNEFNYWLLGKDGKPCYQITWEKVITVRKTFVGNDDVPLKQDSGIQIDNPDFLDNGRANKKASPATGLAC